MVGKDRNLNRVENVVSEREVAFCAGRKDYRDGKPKPEDKWTDNEWATQLNTEMCRLLGWQAERAKVLSEQDRIRRWAEEDGDL